MTLSTAAIIALCALGVVYLLVGAFKAYLNHNYAVRKGEAEMHALSFPEYRARLFGATHQQDHDSHDSQQRLVNRRVGFQ